MCRHRAPVFGKGVLESPKAEVGRASSGRTEPKVAPKPVATGIYGGGRTEPQLLAGDSVPVTAPRGTGLPSRLTAVPPAL